jgi:GTP-binding protein
MLVATDTDELCAGAKVAQTIIPTGRLDSVGMLATLERKTPMFTDEVEIVARSGKGGDGMVHFHREKYVPRGGPDGGDGGKGGDVVVEARRGLATLNALRKSRRQAAADGRSGGPNNMSGRSAADLVVGVPVGTMIYDVSDGQLLGDLTTPGQQVMVCAGGRGGRGNQHFATARNQAPRTAEKGEPGQQRRLRLELRLIADVGIIGVPNAGKSTLLAALTNARPRIADYPFTTLEPNLGVARLDDEISIVLADIPGLIEGASVGAGLGHDFLRHVQRTRVLIHVLDGESSDPVADLTQINSELALFDPMLARKPQVVAFNKMDLPEVRERLKRVQPALATTKVDLVPISALARTDLRLLLMRVLKALSGAPQPPEEAQGLPVYRPAPDPRAFQITPAGPHRWQLAGASIERAAAMTFWEHDGSVRRFQRLMRSLGVDDALRESGIQNGDTVAIGDYELDWQE